MVNEIKLYFDHEQNLKLDQWSKHKSLQGKTKKL